MSSPSSFFRVLAHPLGIIVRFFRCYLLIAICYEGVVKCQWKPLRILNLLAQNAEAG